MAFKKDFYFEDESLKKGFRKLDKIDSAVLMYVKSKEREIVGDMQEHRPWTDRTGEAKKRLFAETTQPEQNVTRITLGHGVKYGISLELEHEKRYAILEPTKRKWEPHLLKGLRTLFDKIEGK